MKTSMLHLSAGLFVLASVAFWSSGSLAPSRHRRICQDGFAEQPVDGGTANAARTAQLASSCYNNARSISMPKETVDSRAVRPATRDDAGGIWDGLGVNAQGCSRVDWGFLGMLDGLAIGFFDRTETVHTSITRPKRPSVDHACINVSAAKASRSPCCYR